MLTHEAYINACTAKVKELIHSGENHISISMPVGFGRNKVLSELLDDFIETVTVITERQEIVDFLTEKLVSRYGDRVHLSTVQDMRVLGATVDGWYILYDLHTLSRKELQSLLLSEKCYTISLGAYGVNVENLQAKQYSFVPVFTTQSILDIRDISEASARETESLEDQYNIDYKRISRTAYAYATCPFNASPEAPEEEIAELQKKMEEARKEAEYYRSIADIYKQLLSAAKLPPSILDDVNSKVLEVKKRYHVSDNSLGDSETEKVLGLLEAEIAKSTVKMSMDNCSTINHERYEDLLKESFTDTVWTKLSEDSKKYLISSKLLFDLYAKEDNADSLDYSGICLETTKAFDTEMARRFYSGYVDYLKKYPIEKWPRTLLNKESTKILAADDFTLGSIQFAIGMNEDGEIKNPYVFRMAKEYARNVLYGRDISKQDIEKKLERCVHCAEKIRRDYRNPAAHRQRIERITAKECLNYIVDTEKMLKEILKDMLV